MKKIIILFILVGFFLIPGKTRCYSATTQLIVDQDVGLNPNNPNTNYNSSTLQYLWVGYPSWGNGNYESMFGFDVSSIVSQIGQGETLRINSMTFSAYHNYPTNKPGNVEVGLGNTDNWDDDVVTWNSSYGDHGQSIDSVNINGSPSWYRWCHWDVSSIAPDELLDGYLTLYLFTQPAGTTNWHLFEASEYGAKNEAYLTIDYDIVPDNTIPIPGAVWLLGSGLLGLVAVRRRKKNS